MKRLFAAAIALSLFSGSVAMAEPWNNHRGDNDHSQDRRHDDHGRGDSRGNDHRSDHNRNESRRDDHRSDYNRNDSRRDDRRSDYNRNDSRRDDRRFDHGRSNWRPPERRFDGRRYDDRYSHTGYSQTGRFRAAPYYRPYGYYQHSWRRGERLPSSYYGPRYVVTNYYSYGLGAPPRGCHWVRVNNDVVLAAITTGIVLDIAYNHFY